MKSDRPRARIAASTVALLGLVGAVLLPAHAAGAAPGTVEIDVLSSRADSVSGGDSLIGVTGATGDVTVTAAGVDVSDAFEPGGPELIGVVEGLPVGVSEIVVRADNAPEGVTLEVTNHPAWGPVFSGPQHPMYCTASGAPWNLGDVDENCHVDEPTVSYRYYSTEGAFADYPVEGSAPADVATATVDGQEVPFIVRIERGTINRAVYESAVLHEPGDPEPSPTESPVGWNGKLAYTFGGACGVGYWQGTGTGGVENAMLLERGYAVASSTLNVYAQNCNDVTSAETAMMVKEHVLEQLGPDEYTIGWGGSAGTMQQLLLANNYPGIIDGVMGEIGYPDERTTTVAGHDCRNLLNYWNSDAGEGWTDAEKVAVTGHAVPGTCFGFTFFDGVDDPNRGCNAAIPEEDRWSPTNPDGLRCTIADMVKNVYGVDDQGRGLRVVPDNVGVQYGLGAFQDGDITAEQFVSINVNAGGMDVDGNRTAERSEASVEAITRAFETGRVNMMTGGLSSIPVIEIRPYTDPTGDFHERYRSAIIRERMLEAYGNADTHVSWTSANDPAVSGQMRELALDRLEEWLDGITAAGGIADRARTVDARPAGLTDGCFDASGTFISETLDYDDPEAQCNTLFPFHSEPRVVAGEPIIRDVLKCQLTEPVRADYPEMTDEQWTSLLEVFPGGVCDWSQPSQGEAELVGTWLQFGGTTVVPLETPMITGEAREDAELTAAVSGSADGAELTYQWFADGVGLDGATSETFTPTADEVGTVITVRVSATAEGYVPAARVSAPTEAVAAATPDPTPTPDPEPEPEPEPTDEPNPGPTDDAEWAQVALSSTEVERGESITVTVTELEPGQQLEATVYSEPYVVSGIPEADADGRTVFTLTIPQSLALGAHTLEITSGDLDAIEVQLEVVSDGSLALTGAQLPWGLALLAAALLVAGGLARFVRPARV